MSTLLPLAAVAALAALSQAQASRRPRQAQPIQPSAGPVRARRGGANDMEEGLRQAWHQTTAAAAQAIQREGFRLDLPRAGRMDTDMPNGVFLKFTADEIGVARTSPEDASEVVQLPVQVMVCNPLRVWNREHLQIILTQDHRYAKLLAEFNRETDHHQKLLTQAEERVIEAYALAWERALRAGQLRPDGSVIGLRDQRLEAAEARVQEIIDEWERRTSKFPKKMQEESTRIIRDMGHDALWMQRDEGSGGRVVQTLVVLDPKKVFITGGASFADELYDLRKGLGLKPGERLDPQTGKVKV